MASRIEFEAHGCMQQQRCSRFVRCCGCRSRYGTRRCCRFPACRDRWRFRESLQEQLESILVEAHRQPVSLRLRSDLLVELLRIRVPAEYCASQFTLKPETNLHTSPALATSDEHISDHVLLAHSDELRPIQRPEAIDLPLASLDVEQTCLR